MRIAIQRVKQASVSVDKQVVEQIGHGLLLLVGFSVNDIAPDFTQIAQRVVQLRVFEDQGSSGSGKLARSVGDVNGGILAVPQFALYADTSKDHRPGADKALAASPARTYFEQFLNSLRDTAIEHVAAGQFGAEMQVSLITDGPMTLILEY